MAIVLALGAAAFYGGADFVGGLAARRNAVLAVALGAQFTGLVVLLVGLPLLGPAAVGPADLAAGAVAGVFGGLGIVVIYRLLARGPMSIVAPTTALSASTVPVVAGLAVGERPGGSALLGIAVALAAVVLITRERRDAATDRTGRVRVVLGALAGGAVFGVFFVALHHSSPDAGLWPLLAARLTSVPVLALLVATRRPPVRLEWRMALPVLVSGAADMVANILFLLASRQGMLAVVSAVTGLYPAATVLLARARLDERLRPVQVTGLGAALAATALVAA